MTPDESADAERQTDDVDDRETPGRETLPLKSVHRSLHNAREQITL